MGMCMKAVGSTWQDKVEWGQVYQYRFTKQRFCIHCFYLEGLRMSLTVDLVG